MTTKKIEDDKLVWDTAERMTRQCLGSGIGVQRSLEAALTLVCSTGCLLGMTKDELVQFATKSIEVTYSATTIMMAAECREQREADNDKFERMVVQRFGG